jgi:hypothetical protein
MCSLGSPVVGCVVYRYACAATSVASGVFRVMLPRSSTDKKDESRFLERFLLSEYSRLSTRERCLLCLPLFVCNALLRASWMALLATLTNSRLLLISFPAALIADVERNGILRVLLYLHLLGWLHRCQLLL